MNALERAAEYLEQHGWTQGHLRDEFRRVCVMGAVVDATPHGEPISLAIHTLNEECWATYRSRLIGEGRQPGDHVIPIVNDRILTDKYQAIDLLKLAAKRLDGDEPA